MGGGVIVLGLVSYEYLSLIKIIEKKDLDLEKCLKIVKG